MAGPKISSDARLAAQPGRLPDFFIVGHGQERHDRPVRDAAAPSADLHAREQGAVVLRDGAARTHAAATGRHAADARGVLRAVRRGRSRAARRRGLDLYLWSHTAAARIAEVAPDARIIAILREPASFLRSLHMQFVETYVESRPICARRSRSRTRGEGRKIPRYTYWPQTLLYSEHVRYVEQLRRFRELFGPEQDARADLRRLPRRQRGDGAPGAALLWK
jgi:hypothetical protein